MRRSKRVFSLRSRLFVLIVVPLIFVALASSVVLYWNARNMSGTLYDDTLKVVAHAVSREVVLTKGDLVAQDLLDSLVGALGDPIYYQVRAADGHFVTGHSDAPVPANEVEVPGGTPVFFDAEYHDRPVRVVVLREFIADLDFDGWTTVTIWQTVYQRQALSMSLLGQSMANLLLMVAAAAALVWFGINRGLAPLTDLRSAVALRSATELHPIRRPVPPEVAPLVQTINSLFERLGYELDRRNAFISNAAHQLRNPVAAIQAQAESAITASSQDAHMERLHDLSESARRLSRMSHQLLNFDVAAETKCANLTMSSDLRDLVAAVARRHVPRALKGHVDIELEAGDDPLPVQGNRIMLEEAVDNLIDNALKYGCSAGQKLRISVQCDGDDAVLTVTDSGPGIPLEDIERVFGRFVRLREDGDGCGLGLSIVRAIASSAGGQVGFLPSAVGCTVRLALPMALDTRSPTGADSASRDLYHSS
ncbi:sensor histidine kinase [Devosia sp. 2618]|uniref:sensor histidine kinase n=1 Tax=Devosia sp. 2618 TaxID=3156454 RepID=UPI003391D5E1